MNTISVFVCESQPIVIEGLKRVIGTSPELQLVGETVHPEATTELVAGLRPDVALIDQSFGSRTALELVERVRAASDATQAVLWVTSLTETDSFRALQAGARGILKKTLPPSSVVECLRAVGQGNIWIDNSISNQMVGYLNRRDVPRLTAREQEVVELICRGMKNKQIADRLATTGTVKVHLMHIFEKTGIRDRLELAMEAGKVLGFRTEEGFGNLRGCQR